MDQPLCPPNADYYTLDPPPRFASLKRWLFISLMTGASVLLVYGFFTLHRDTEQRVRQLQTEMSQIVEHLGDVTRMRTATQAADSTAAVTDHQRPPPPLSQQATAQLVQQYTDKLQADLHHTSAELRQLRSTVDALKVSVALHGGGAVAASLPAADYALESLGGSVEHIGGSTRLPGSYLAYLLGVRSLAAPRRCIQPTQALGECFAFYGQVGEIVLRLRQPVYVEAVSVDHVAAEMVPGGDVRSAPKRFAVYGLDGASGRQHYFGQFEYRLAGAGMAAPRTLQVFEIPATLRTDAHSFQLVQFRFLGNHGNAEHTCVYQVKVHGKPEAGYAVDG